MPPARPTRFVTLIFGLSLGAAAVHADVGATLAVQTDARDRGLSYSANKPSAQLGVVWDGDGGWYAGASLSRPRFSQQSGFALRAYGGRVVELRPGLDAEAGLLAYRFENVSRYDFAEAYLGVLGERWNVRLFASPNYYGAGQRSVYGEFNLQWPLTVGLAAIGHVGLLHGWGGSAVSYLDAGGPRRVDWRGGLSWPLGERGELQLAWVAVGRGGPYTWGDTTRRHTLVVSLTTAF